MLSEITELFTPNLFADFYDDAVGNVVLCVACTLMLSYLREVPPKFERKRMAAAGVILCIGAFASRLIAHYRIVDDKIDDEMKLIKQTAVDLILENDLSQKQIDCIYGNLIATFIGFVCICAGAFILMGIFKAKHIAPMAIVQISGFLLKEVFKGLYSDLINKIFFHGQKASIRFYGYNGFAYGCFMIIMIIMYILITKRMYEIFWTKRVNVWKHVVSIAGLFAAYTIIMGVINRKEAPSVEFKLLLTTLSTAVLILVPLLTYSFTRSELQSDFFEVKRTEEIERLEYSQAQYTAIIKYIHDLPAHFREIDSMAVKIRSEDIPSSAKSEAEEISRYVDNLSNALIEAKCEFSTGNANLDDLLVDELKNARKSNVNIVFKGSFPNEGISRTDMTTIFHNLIKNAVEACSKVSGKREVTIKSSILDNRVYVDFLNPFAGKAKKNDGKFETSKKNKKFHGYGLSNVEKAVKRKEYDGSLTIEQKDNIFTVSIDMKFKQ